MNIFFNTIIIMLIIAAASANAVSLAKKPVDDSVCDLSTMTTFRLSQRNFVEARTREEENIYVRLALRFATQECKNGQVLILHSEDGIDFDALYFRSVTAQLCDIPSVQRESAGTHEYPQAFLMRCPISKLDEATEALAKLERSKTTEQMIQEGAPHRSSQQSPHDDERKKCGESITWAMVALGWGGNCR